MEPRARASRHKSTLNFGDELTLLLHGTGTPSHPDITHPLPDSSSTRYLSNLPRTTLNTTHPRTAYSRTVPPTTGSTSSTQLAIPYPETLRVLDEIVTDYIIETSHAALQIATYAGRAKLKRSDFEFVMRRDRRKLGRVQEMFRKQKKVQQDRRAAGGIGEEGGGGMDMRRMQVNDLQALGDIVGEEGTGRGKGKGRGRRKKRNADEAELEGVTNEGTIRGGAAGGSGNGILDELGDIEVDIENDLEDAREDEGNRHKSKRARSEMH